MENLNMMLRRMYAIPVFVLAVAGSAMAEPSSEVSWTVPVLKALRFADVDRGKEIAEQACAECHLITGIDPDALYPSIAGQRATYIYKQLVDVLGNNRQNRRMRRKIDELTDQDLLDVAAYYATRPMDSQGEQAPMPELVRLGDQSRMINSCRSCHGEGAEGGDIDVPILAGQQVDQLILMLEQFRDGTRTNDIYGRMREAAASLTDDEIESLARYYAGVPVQ